MPFRRAAEINGQNLAGHFPEIDKLKGPRRVAFDVEKIFFAPIPAHYADITEQVSTPASRSRCWSTTGRLRGPTRSPASSASPLRDAPAPAPTAKSAGAPPPFFGLTPATGPATRLGTASCGRWWRAPAKRARPVLEPLLAREGLPAYDGSIYQLPWDTVTRMFATGAAAMDFDGIRWPDNHTFAGPLLPPRTGQVGEVPVPGQAHGRGAVVVVSRHG